MFNSTTLEVAIGMAFVYLLISLFCTAIREGIAQMLNSRAKNLEKGIKSLFTEEVLTKAGAAAGDGAGQVSFTDAIYRHGLVQSLYRSGTGVEETLSHEIKQLPSYIPSRTFASALLDLLLPNLTPAGEGVATAPADAATAAAAIAGKRAELAGMVAELDALPDSKAKEAILTLVKQAGGDFNKTRKAFEAWYDDAMDRAAGWYKRETQVILFALGLVIAVALNVDSIAIARALWSTPAMRTYAVKLGEEYAQGSKVPAAAKPATAATAPDPAEEGRTAPPSSAIADNLTELQSLSLPIGWTHVGFVHSSGGERAMLFVFALAGWLLTAVAVTFGAPFWFDTLNQFMVVRSTIKPREKSDVEGSKDSQNKK